MLTTVGGHWELQAAALLKAVWWDFRLAHGLVCQYVSPHDNFRMTKRRTIKLGG